MSEAPLIELVMLAAHGVYTTQAMVLGEAGAVLAHVKLFLAFVASVMSAVPLPTCRPRAHDVSAGVPDHLKITFISTSFRTGLTLPHTQLSRRIQPVFL